MDSKKKFCSTQFYAFQLKLDTVILLGVFIGKTVKEMQMRPKMRPYFVSYLSNGLHICLDRNLNSQAQKDFIWLQLLFFLLLLRGKINRVEEMKMS